MALVMEPKEKDSGNKTPKPKTAKDGSAAEKRRRNSGIPEDKGVI